jgi:hypothetical protein
MKKSKRQAILDAKIRAMYGRVIAAIKASEASETPKTPKYGVQ